MLVLSPHLDDAVLSAWHVLSSPGDVRVVTVYGGVPSPGFLTDLDRAHGARESAAWLRRRRDDDRAALALAGREPVHLDLLEVQFPAYRIDRLREAIARDPSHFLSLVVDEPALRTPPETLDALVREHIHPGLVVVGPAGIGGHPDHRDLAQAAVRLAGEVRQVRLYADSPYYLFDGLPACVTGRPNPAADRRVDEALAGLVPHPSGLLPEVVRLDADALAHKFAAMRRYTTEFPSIEADLSRPGRAPEMMAHELYWTLPDAVA